MKKLTPYEAYTLAKNLFDQDGKTRLVWLFIPKNGDYPYCQVTCEYEAPMTDNGKELNYPLNNKDFSLELLETIGNKSYIMTNVGEV